MESKVWRCESRPLFRENHDFLWQRPTLETLDFAFHIVRIHQHFSICKERFYKVVSEKIKEHYNLIFCLIHTLKPACIVQRFMCLIFNTNSEGSGFYSGLGLTNIFLSLRLSFYRKFGYSLSQVLLRVSFCYFKKPVGQLQHIWWDWKVLLWNTCKRREDQCLDLMVWIIIIFNKYVEKLEENNTN